MNRLRLYLGHWAILFFLTYSAWRAERRLNRLRQAIMHDKLSVATKLGLVAWSDPVVQEQRKQLLPPMLSMLLCQEPDFYDWVHTNVKHTDRFHRAMVSLRALMPKHYHEL